MILLRGLITIKNTKGIEEALKDMYVITTNYSIKI